MRIIFLFALAAIIPYVGEAATLIDSTSVDALGNYGLFMAKPTSARALGMGSAYSAVADDASGVVWNPAGIAQLRSFHGVAIYEAGPEDADITFSYIAASFPIKKGTIGFGYLSQDLGSYEMKDSGGVPIGTESLSEIMLSAAWAIPNPPWFMKRGWSGFIIEMGKDAVDETAIAIGGGGLVPISDTAKVGLSILHVGLAKDGFSPPVTINAGVSYFHNKQILLASDIQYRPYIGEITGLCGMESCIGKMMLVRAGAIIQPKDAISNRTAILALNVGLGFRMKRIALDMAYQPQQYLGSTIRFGLSIGR